MQDKNEVVTLLKSLWAQKKYKSFLTLLRKSSFLSAEFYYTSLAYAYIELGKFRTASIYLLKVISSDPSNHALLKLLAQVYCVTKRYTRAKQYIELALTIEPDNAFYIKIYSEILLHLCDFSNAWQGYEFRKLSTTDGRYLLNNKTLDNQSVLNKNILVYTEQGLGDSIQFSRYLPYLIMKAKNVVLLCENQLIRLFSQIKNLQVLSKNDTEIKNLEYDYNVALHSLPIALNIIDPPPPLDFNITNSHYNLQLSSEYFHIGIVWRGSNINPGRDAPLHYWNQLIKFPFVQFHSFQLGKAREEIKSNSLRDVILDHSHNISDLMDTASLISQMNLIITIDTSIVHLAGSLNINTWVLLKYSSCWRWEKKHSRLIWYPQVRTFTQRREGEWKDVFEEAAYALKTLLSYNKFLKKRDNVI